jgi:hypothetical protein
MSITERRRVDRLYTLNDREHDLRQRPVEEYGEAEVDWKL